MSEGAKQELLAAARAVLDEYEKRISEFRFAGDSEVLHVCERYHGKRMERLRKAIAAFEI